MSFTTFTIYAGWAFETVYVFFSDTHFDFSLTRLRKLPVSGLNQTSQTPMAVAVLSDIDFHQAFCGDSGL